MFNFNPPSGLLDINSFPTDPGSETEARQQFMALFNQMKEYLNQNEIESGSNSNGDYIKFPDGTLICKRDDTYSDGLDMTNKVVEGVYGGQKIVYTFPVPFVGKPPSISANTKASVYLNNMAREIDNTKFEIAIWTNYPADSVVIKPRYFAIGRWK